MITIFSLACRFFFHFFKSICPKKSNSWFYLVPPTLFTEKWDLRTIPHLLALLSGFPLPCSQRDSCFCFTVSVLATSLPEISGLWGKEVPYLLPCNNIWNTFVEFISFKNKKNNPEVIFLPANSEYCAQDLDCQLLHHHREERFCSLDLIKLLMMGTCMRKETSSFSHPFLLLSEEKIAKTTLQEKSFSLAGSGLPFSKFIQAVFMGDSFFRCPASKYSRCGCFLSLKRGK